MYSAIRHFFSFLSNPEATVDSSAHWTRKLLACIGILFAMFSVNIFVGILQTLLVRSGLIGDAIGSFEKPAYIRQMPDYAIFLEFVVLAPLLEELAFRGLLQRSAWLIRLSVSVILYLTVCRIFGLNFYRIDRWTMVVAMLSVLAFFCWKGGSSKLKDFLAIRRVRLAVLWCGCLLFALWHYHNFSLEGMDMPTVVVHLLPFFINGLLLAWTGQRFGLPWGIGVHAANNAWPFLLLG